MEILLWLVPAAVVTTAAMVWAAWVGRDQSNHDEDRVRTAARLGRALASDRPVRYAPRPAPHTESNGVAIRPPSTVDSEPETGRRAS
ncbi:MAG: hypothetical protein QM714_08685 [Nocardioides sp.]|uniref:hypothetical protein n=1 Tax=Nocardioides sp. TaxID=35761 RepID=UPI0039E2786D